MLIWSFRSQAAVSPSNFAQLPNINSSCASQIEKWHCTMGNHWYCLNYELGCNFNVFEWNFETYASIHSSQSLCYLAGLISPLWVLYDLLLLLLLSKDQWSSIQDKTFEIEARPDILDYFFSFLVPFNYNFRR